MDKDIENLIRAYAKRKYGQNQDFEDILQDGMVGAWQAEKRYLPGFGATLCTFVFHRAKGAMIDGIRERRYGKRGPEVHVVPMYVRVDGPHGTFELISDKPTRPTCEDEVMRDSVLSEIYGCCKDDIDASIIDDIVSGKSYTQIANEHGWTQAAITHRLNPIRQKMRERLAA